MLYIPYVLCIVNIIYDNMHNMHYAYDTYTLSYNPHNYDLYLYI